MKQFRILRNPVDHARAGDSLCVSCLDRLGRSLSAARKRGRRPGRPALDRETVSATQALVEAGLTARQAAKQLGIGRATAYRIAKAAR